MAATINNEPQPPVDVPQKEPPDEQDSNIDVPAANDHGHNDNKNSAASDEDIDIRTAKEISNTFIDLPTQTMAGDGDGGSAEYENDDEGIEEDEEDEEEHSAHNNINPLNHAQDMEMETIRNSYKNSESDLNDSGSVEDDGGLSSPGQGKRVTMFQSVPLPDDFLLSATLAIRTSILAGDSKRRFLDDSDFQSTRKYKISMAGDKKSEIKDFAPVVFSHIRKKYGITMQSYLMSWSDDKLIKHKASGKSDALFVHSPDGKYILKTIPKSEASRLRKILMDYYQHLETYPDSLISKVFGLHRVTRRRGVPKIYFAIFNNVFDSNNSFNEVFDLKGSSVGRRASVGEHVMKDLDLGDKQRVHLPDHIKTRILEQITADCQFLSRHHLMDYSLLVGIRRSTDEDKEVTTPRGGHNQLDQRLPGLLFFLESTKNVETGHAKRVLRRKSLTMGKPLFASMEDLREGIDEIEVSQNTELNKGLSNFHESPELGTSPDLTSDVGSSPEKEKNKDSPSPVLEQKLRKIAMSESHIPIAKPDGTPSPGGSPTSKLHAQPIPTLRGVLKRGASECRLVTSSSAPHLNTRKDANGGVYVNDYATGGHIPFYQLDDGGLRSQRPVVDESNNAQHFEVYHFGIIDFLQKYNKKKKFANFAKSLKYEKEAISTVDPAFYMQRFLKMAEKVIGVGSTTPALS